MHPALLDMATGCALYLTRGYESTRDLYLPVFYKRIRCYSQIPPKVFSHILSRGENVGGGAVAVFDVKLFDEHGQVLVEIEGFTMRLIADPLAISGNAKAPTNDLRENRSTIEDGDRLTIPVSDGVHSLVRLLQAETPPSLSFRLRILSSQNLLTKWLRRPRLAPRYHRARWKQRSSGGGGSCWESNGSNWMMIFSIWAAIR